MIQKLNNVEAIVAVDKNFGLAKENTIPWKSKKDMEFFKRKTIYNIVIMGFIFITQCNSIKRKIKYSNYKG
jgi:hypothetical protein